MKAIVLTFDRLPAHLLGCYGNDWMETPHWDRLASRSAVYDQHFVELPGPVGPEHSWWTGRYEFFRSGPGGESVLETLKSAGVECRLIAESQSGLPTERFTTAESVDGWDGLDAPHEDVPFARLVQRADEFLRSSEGHGPTLLWLHSRGIPGPWIPPRFFAELYLDEFEDAPDESDETHAAGWQQAAAHVFEQLIEDQDLRELVLSERLLVHETADEPESESMTHHPTSGVTESGIGQLRPRDLNTSDVFESETFELLRRMSKFVFAGYVTLIDHWLGRLTTMIESLDQPYLLIVTAASGQAFGERDLLLPEGLQNQMATELDDATLHTPLIIRTSQGPRFGTRHAELTQPVDLAPTLLDWFRQSPSRHLDGSSLLHRSGQSDQRERFAYHIGSQGEIGIRDADRLLIAEDAEKLRAQPIEACDHEPIGRLYVKPDDRWQVHDVAQQEPSTQLRLAKQLQTRLKKG